MRFIKLEEDLKSYPNEKGREQQIDNDKDSLSRIHQLTLFKGLRFIRNYRA